MVDLTTTPTQPAGDDPDSIEQVPKLIEAVKRKLEEALLKLAEPGRERKPLYITLNVRGRALFDLAYILSKVPAGSPDASRVLELCDAGKVAYTMIRIIAIERKEASGFAAKSAVLALSVLANMACINAYAQLLAPEINALGLFLELIQDPVAQKQSGLVLPYAVAGMRNLASQEGAAEQLRATGGEALLRTLLARPDLAKVLDAKALAHATKTLNLINELSQAAAKPPPPTEARRHAAAINMQAHIRRYLAGKAFEYAKAQRSDEQSGTTSASLQELMLQLSGDDPALRAKSSHNLADFAANCSSYRLAELAESADALMAELAPERNNPPTTHAYVSCVIANLSYTPTGQQAAIRSGAADALLGVLRQYLKAPTSEADAAAVLAALSQTAAALQNLSYEQPALCDTVVAAGGVAVLTQIMSSTLADESCQEYAAGVLTNLQMYATGGIQGDEQAISLIVDKHQRTHEREANQATRIQAAWRGKRARDVHKKRQRAAVPTNL